MESKTKEPTLIKIMSWLFPRLEKYAPGMAKKLFVQIFFTPARYPYPSKELPYLEAAEKWNLPFKGRHVQVYKWGAGPSVLMVHGWMGRGTQFRKFVDAFTAAGYSVIAFDAPAHGKSGGLKSHLMYFVQVIEALGKEHQFQGIIGHSLGGVAGLHAIHRSAVVKKLIMIGSPSISDDIIGEFLRRLNGSWMLADHFKEYIQKTYNQPFEHYTAAYIIQYIKDLQLLLVYDEDDIEVNIKHGEKLKENYSAATLVKTRGLGHTRILKDDEVVRRCLEFINR